MNRTHFAYLFLLAAVATASCAQEDLTTPGDGSGGTAPQAGSGGVAGTATGGTVASGGTLGGGGGSAPTGGVSTGGTVGTGGDTGGVSPTGGMGGTVIGGMGTGGGAGSDPTGGSGGMTATGGAGMGGQAGTAPGGRSGGGAGGTMAGAAGSGTLDPEVIVPDFNGFYWEGTCVGTRDAGGKNCPLDDSGATCPTGTSYDTRGVIRNRTFPVHGTMGTTYTINFEVRGVAGTRCYTGGTPASTATPNPSGANNTFYRGGRQANDSIWNTYELHVEGATVAGEANVYFFNGFPANPDWCQKEATYEIGYTASFKVMGNSMMRFTVHDSNCQAQQNCGSNEQSTMCESPRTVNLAGMTPPATFTQPPTNVIGTRTYRPQWLYFSVRSITSP